MKDLITVSLGKSQLMSAVFAQLSSVQYKTP